MILISYPSGGFGNFLYHCLTEFSSNTYKPGNDSFSFDLMGRSHDTKKYIPTYFLDPDNYQFTLPETNLECLVLCDNGITNDSYDKINKTFPEASIVRVVIDDAVRPVIYKTCVFKAKNSDTITETKDQVVANWSDAEEDYAVRENFTLLYHNWPFKWQADKQCINVSLEELITDPVKTIESLISTLHGKIVDKDRLLNNCKEWQCVNEKYFKIYWDWTRIAESLGSNFDIDISDITELHDQGYINYCIEKNYNRIIPVYDYRNWFKNTKDIREFLNETNNTNNK
jgi:hypothetical protein